MRLRVRVGGRTGFLELEGEQPTLGELRAKLSESFLPALGYRSDVVFHISLNGKDTLTEDEKTLETCDIISGDLIYLLMPVSQLATAAPLLVPAPSPGHQLASPSAVIAQPRNMACDRENHQREELSPGGQDVPERPGPSSCYGATVGEEAPVKVKVFCPLSEPILVSESADGKIPHSLESLYLSAGCTAANDALMVVIHLLMLETGYVVQGMSRKDVAMPEDWRHGDGVYKLRYTHPLCGESSAVLACIPMGRLLIINATLTMNQGVKCVKRLQLPTHSYIKFPGQENHVSSVFGDLQKLSRVVKDQLVYPFLAATRQALELPDAFGLLALPPELKMRIFRLLDVWSLLLLSSTCKQLRADSEDPTLWKYLYKRDFDDPISRGPQTNWMGLYTVMYETRYSQLRRPRYPPTPATPPPQLYPPYPFSLDPYHHIYPPGIIGGDYDQRPVLPFTSDPRYIIRPGRRPAMGPFQPVRPHFPAFRR